MSHEPIQCGVFNRDFCSSAGAHNAWAQELTNNEEVLRLLCSRMQSDFEGTALKMRKHYTGPVVEPCLFRNWQRAHGPIKETLQRCCALFSACKKAFMEKHPKKFVDEELPNIERARFGHEPSPLFLRGSCSAMRTQSFWRC